MNGPTEHVHFPPRDVASSGSSLSVQLITIASPEKTFSFPIYTACSFTMVARLGPGRTHRGGGAAGRAAQRPAAAAARCEPLESVFSEESFHAPVKWHGSRHVSPFQYGGPAAEREGIYF